MLSVLNIIYLLNILEYKGMIGFSTSKNKNLSIDDYLILDDIFNDLGGINI